MPRRKATPCAHRRCPKLSHGRFCEHHTRTERRRYDRARGSAASRGYDAKWRKLRALKIAADPLCEECKRAGRYVPTQEVDHITPFHGPDDPLRLDFSNLQSLCKPCHSRKTAGELGWSVG